MKTHIVIAGGGLAAQRAVETLRRNGHEGPVTVLCGEPLRPYDRPPLSKDVLAGDTDAASLTFRPDEWYAEQEIELRLGRHAVGLEPDAHKVVLDDGDELGYDRLLIATGSEARRFELLDGRPNVLSLRTAGDARELRAMLVEGARLVIVGAGFIGMEVAATARKLGVQVTMLEAMPQPLVGLLGEDLGAWFADMHRAEGVDVRCLTTATDIVEGPDGRVDALITGHGDQIDCDAVVVGIGVLPADGWLAGSGLGPGGVEIDAAGRTAVPDVFAAGDVARPFDERVGARVRSEHWEAAGRQGMSAAKAMLGLDVPPPPIASFWSDQYGMRVQQVGYPHLADGQEEDGDRAARDFTVTWTRGGAPVGGLLVGRPRGLPALRQAVEATFSTDPQETGS